MQSVLQRAVAREDQLARQARLRELALWHAEADFLGVHARGDTTTMILLRRLFPGRRLRAGDRDAPAESDSSLARVVETVLKGREVTRPRRCSRRHGTGATHA